MDAIYDTSMSRLTKSINAIGEAFEEFKKTNDERIEALAGGKDFARGRTRSEARQARQGASPPRTDLKKKIEIEQTFMRERIEELESRSNQPGRTMAEKRQSEYKTTFMEWVRYKGQSPLHEQQLQNIVRSMVEAKDVTIASGPGGGFAVPEEISREIERMELLFSPVRRLVKVVTAGSSDYKELVNTRGTTAGWVGESGPRPATATSQLREVCPDLRRALLPIRRSRNGRSTISSSMSRPGLPRKWPSSSPWSKAPRSFPATAPASPPAC